MTKNLNLGSGYSGDDALYIITGSQKNPDWTHIDICPLYQYGPNYQCYDFTEGIREPDSSVARIWIGDCLEHILKVKTKFVLSECFRVLQPGGELLVSVPDMMRVLSMWLHHEGVDMPYDCDSLIYGQQDARDRKNEIPDSHFAGFSEKSLTRLLNEAGFVNVRRVSVHSTWYELAVRATKPGVAGA